MAEKFGKLIQEAQNDGELLTELLTDVDATLAKRDIEITDVEKEALTATVARMREDIAVGFAKLAVASAESAAAGIIGKG